MISSVWKSTFWRTEPVNPLMFSLKFSCFHFFFYSCFWALQARFHKSTTEQQSYGLFLHYSYTSWQTPFQWIPITSQVFFLRVSFAHVKCLQSQSIKKPYKMGCLMCFLLFLFSFLLQAPRQASQHLHQVNAVESFLFSMKGSGSTWKSESQQVSCRNGIGSQELLDSGTMLSMNM